jgi:type IV secretory pathway VirB4 component
VCRLDLQGFDGELAVISGRARHLERLQRLLGEHGADPERWLPVFMTTCRQE